MRSVESPGTVIPAGGVTALSADAALMANVPNAAAAEMAAPTPYGQAAFRKTDHANCPSGSAADASCTAVMD